MRIYQFIALLVFCILQSCDTEFVENGDPIPKIQFISIEPDSVFEFKENVLIQIKYQDGDGDLGDDNADSLNVFVRDSRLNDWDRYHLPLIAPVNSSPSIQGNFTLKLKNIFLLGNGTEESLFFEIYLKDRKGNKSNIIKTNQIKVVR